MHNEELEAKLKQAKNLKELNQALCCYLEEKGFKHYAFTYYSYYPNTQHRIKYHFASKPYQCWHDHYLEEGYHDIDTTLDHIYRSTLPVYWELDQQLKEAKTARERQMRLDSIELGMEKGICIPVHGYSGDFAELLVAQGKGETCLENWKTIRAELFLAAHWYYYYLQNHLREIQPKQGNISLSNREKQVLLLIAKNTPLAEIAKNMAITERTVNYHIQRINKKLGVKNKHQAAAKALELGIILL